ACSSSSASPPVCSVLASFFTAPASLQFSTLSLHDALPISTVLKLPCRPRTKPGPRTSVTWCASSEIATRYRFASTRSNSASRPRSEEHTSELQSPDHLVCRLLLEKKKMQGHIYRNTRKNLG